MLCEKCKTNMIHVCENSVQGWSCPVCGWGTLTTYIDKIHQDMTEYSICTKSITNIDKDKIKVISKIEGVNYIVAKKMLEKEGADPAILIDPREVATAPWTVFKCQFGCSSYGHNHCCPPKAPSYDKTRKILDCYSTGILFRIHGWNATAMAFRCSREIFLDGYYKTIAFGSGMCKLCQSCDPAGCRQPERAIPSMEACGIDVFATARHFGLEIDTLRCPNEKRNHFGLVLIE